MAALKDYDREKELAVGVALRKGRRQCTMQKKKPEPGQLREVVTSSSSGGGSSANISSGGGNNNNNGVGASACKSGMKPILLELEDKETPLQTLIKVASVMNPKQFQLPPELTCTTHLPGKSSFARCRSCPSYS